MLLVDSSGTVTAANGWIHLMGSFDMSDTGKRHLYNGGTSDLSVVTTYTDANMNWTVGEYSVGAVASGAGKLTADIADLWVNNTYIDLSVQANRERFRTRAGKPANLGPNGAQATGAPPLVFLAGATAAWHTNKGTGGGFTLNGTLTTSTTSPSK